MQRSQQSITATETSNMWQLESFKVHSIMAHFLRKSYQSSQHSLQLQAWSGKSCKLVVHRSSGSQNSSYFSQANKASIKANRHQQKQAMESATTNSQRESWR